MKCFSIDNKEQIAVINWESHIVEVDDPAILDKIYTFFRGLSFEVTRSHDDYNGFSHATVYETSVRSADPDKFVICEGEIIGYLYFGTFIPLPDDVSLPYKNKMTWDFVVVYEPPLSPVVLRLSENDAEKARGNSPAILYIEEGTEVFPRISTEYLIELYLPCSLKKIDYYAFSEANNLKNVYFNGTVGEWNNIDFVYSTSSPLSIKGVSIRFKGQSFDGIIELDGDVKPNTWANADVKEIVFSSSVHRIGKRAFCGCNNLKKVIFSEGLEEIEAEAFVGSAISELSFPSSLKRIGKRAFDNSRVKRIIFAEGLEEIGESSFSFCKDIEEVTLPASLRTIGEYAFYADKSLKKVVFSGKTPKKITDSAFQYCNALQIVQLPSECEILEGDCFQGSDISTIALPETLREICELAFADSPLTQLDFPASVKQVYLRDLNNLSKVTLFKTLEKLVIDMKNNHKELSIIYLGKRKDFEKVEKRVFYYDYVVTCLDGDVPLKANRCGF